MSDPIHEFYNESPGKGHFSKVIALHEIKGLDWELLSKQAPLLPRGWFELSQLSLEDRIDFTRAFWFAKIPFLASDGTDLEKRLGSFFDNLAELGIYLTQTTAQQPFEAHMVYGLKEDEGFFHGFPPANKESIAALCKQFGTFHLPEDYLCFLEIHDGFSKYTDTGIVKTRDMAKVYLKFQEFLSQDDLIGPDGEGMNPSHLIPFYESTNLHCYQCFFADWYPSEEMGNVFYSEEENEVSNYLNERRWEDNHAYPTFLRWLVSYLEETPLPNIH